MLLPPVDEQESGRRRHVQAQPGSARTRVSGRRAIYDLVYTAERPELFFKALLSFVGPDQPVHIRRDSK